MIPSQPRQPLIQTTHRNTPSPIPEVTLSQPHQPLIRTPSLPVVLWTQQWVAPNFPEDQIIPLADLRSTAFREATEGSNNVEKFELRRPNVRELATAFSNRLGEAAEHGDFTSVLSPQRDFVM